MQQTFLVTLPFFALVFCGFLATRSKIIPVDSIPGLNGFVLYFALPSMLYRFGAGTPIDELLDIGVIFIYLTCALIIVGLTVWLSRRGSMNWTDTSFGALVAAFPNSGFLGMPLLISLLGGYASAPLIISLSIDLVIISSLCIALSRWGVAGESNLRTSALFALRGVVTNPLPWAILLGGMASASEFSLHETLMKPINMLADAGPPAALFTIGAVLARSKMKIASPADADRGHSWHGVFPIVLVKLVLHPLLVLFVGFVAIEFGLALERSALIVLVLIAALPSASNVPILAERYGADTERISRIVLVTTIISFVSFTLMVAMLA